MCNHANSIQNDWFVDSNGNVVNEMYCLDCDKLFEEFEYNFKVNS